MSTANRLAALDTLFESPRGRAVPLPAKLARLYGDFRLPSAASRSYVFSNFVSTMDGVVSLQVRGHDAGGDISGFSTEDRMVMGLLRAVADTIIVGSGTLAADSQSVWTPASICPELAGEYRRLQNALQKPQAALNVVVSARGNLDLRLPVFASGQVPALIVTTQRGERRLRRQKQPHRLEIRAVTAGTKIPPASILSAVRKFNAGKRILVEGGPQLLGDFYRRGLIDEQFLTLAPQIAGREPGDGRLSLVMGALFAPSRPLWGRLIDVRRGQRQLFLRYSFAAAGRVRS
jgi:riboflavin biosynthesis pyrimidine reductase